MDLNKLTDKEKDLALNEIRLLASINHPNIIAYKETFAVPELNILCMVLEHA
jgi:NIMA (never in mitosis gene a)-related kinase 1/4/5